MIKLTYNNLIELRKKAEEAIAFPDKFTEEQMLMTFYKYTEFFNDFREEGHDHDIKMITREDALIAYTALYQIMLRRK